MKVEKERVELAALLDGEIRDAALAGRLAELVASNAELKSAYDEQRQIKSLLASLPEHAAPDFMATRIMGTIASRRRQPAVWVKPVTMSASALLVLVITLTIATQQMVGPEPVELRGESQPTAIDYRLASDSGNYKPQDWRLVSAPEGVTDERLIDFIEFASEAHAYRLLQRNTDMMSPDIAQAILVLDREGN